MGPSEWAEQQFGEVQLGDVRRARRAVKVAAQMAAHPAASLPAQAGHWAATKGGYRFFAQEQVTFETLQAPHWEATRQAAGQRGVVLMIEDTSDLNFSNHPATIDLGPIGDGRARGLMLHSTLAVDPEGSGEVLGLACQMLFARQSAPARESRAQRKGRARESEIWPTSVRAVGGPPAGRRWVQVCDRYADNFEVFEACRQTTCDFVIRAAQDRRAASGHDADQPNTLLLQGIRALPAAGATNLQLRRRPNRQPREVALSVSWMPVTIFPPWLESKRPEPLKIWAVRVWEPNTPAGEERIEWVLLSSVPVTEPSEALLVAYWYSLRWLVEEYHKCLKTGCAAEDRQLEHVERLRPCLGMLAIVAVRLLQLKLYARSDPQRPAERCAPPCHVRVLAAYRKRSVENWTVYDFWRDVAKLGGFLGRKGDGEPGWQTIWRGWQKLDLMTLGASLPVAQESVSYG